MVCVYLDQNKMFESSQAIASSAHVSPSLRIKTFKFSEMDIIQKVLIWIFVDVPQTRKLGEPTEVWIKKSMNQIHILRKLWEKITIRP